jgi:zinc transporter 1/2/3
MSGSILLGFGFLHILPDAADDFSEYLDSVNNYPIVYLIAAVSLFSMIVLNTLLKSFIESNTEKGCNCTNCGNPKCSGTEKGCKCSELQTHAHTVVVSYHNEHNDHSNHNHVHAVDIQDNNKLSSYFLTFAMSFHSIFEGIALGINTDLTSSIFLLIGLVFHKICESISMGVYFKKKGIEKRLWIPLVIFFSLIAPLGTGIGWIIQDTVNQDTLSLVSSILNAIAVGIFLYISILEISLEEFTKREGIFLKFFIFNIGVGLTGCLSFFE